MAAVYCERHKISPLMTVYGGLFVKLWMQNYVFGSPWQYREVVRLVWSDMGLLLLVLESCLETLSPHCVRHCIPA